MDEKKQLVNPVDSFAVAKKTGTSSFRALRGMTSVTNVLETVVSSLKLDKRLKEHTVISLWQHIVGEPMASRTHALFIDHEGKLVVAVSDPVIAQELSMLKTPLTKKLAQLSNSIGISVKGVRFDTKQYHSRKEAEKTSLQSQIAIEESTQSQSPKYAEPTDEELAAITLSNSDKELLAGLISSFEKDSAADTTDLVLAYREKIVRLFERELRYKMWCLNQGLPKCAYCQRADYKMRSPADKPGIKLCLHCYYLALAKEIKV